MKKYDSRVIWYRERGEGQECSNLHALVFNNNQAVRFTSLNNDESKIKELIENFKFLGNEGDYEPQAYIQDGNVYYVNESGEKIKITESITNPKNPVDVQNYKKVLLSPNNKFIALISLGWEIIGVEVYDIQNKKMYQANEAGNNLSWLPDNRLKLIAECGMGISCGVYESEDNLKPWIFKKVANINF